MKVVEYNDNCDIVVEFQDEYKYRTKNNWNNFVKGKIKNLYFPTVFNIGIIGSKYPSFIGSKITKEYQAWANMLYRCFCEKEITARPSYKNVTCCKEWLL